MLWRKIIAIKYGADLGDWWPVAPSSSHGCSLWKSICEELPFFKSQISFQVGNGTSIALWDHHWISTAPLKLLFPNLHAAAANSNITVAEARSHNSWSLVFRRRLRGTEGDDFVQLLDILYSKPLRSIGQDKICWNNSSQTFSVSSCYALSSPPPESASFPNHIIWNNLAPPKAQLLAWRAYWRGVPTIDVLNRRGLQIPSRCCLCKQDGESIDHLFIQCRVSSTLWHSLWLWKGIATALPSNLQQHINSWPGNETKSPKGKLWNAALLAGLITIWNSRNGAIFRDESIPQLLFSSTLKLLFEWHQIRGGNKPLSLPQILSFWM